MIRVIYYRDGVIRTDLPTSDFPAVLKDPAALLWVDFEATPPAEDELILRDVFGFHPLAVDDALQETHVPKLDDWDDYLYIVLHAVLMNPQEREEVETLELDIFLGKNYMVTHHDKPIEALNKVWENRQRDPRLMRNGLDRMLYRLVDEIIGGYMPVVDMLDDAIDDVEDKIFDNPGPDILERIFTLKRSVIQLRRIIAPQREVLNRLARDEFHMIDAHDRIYFRDVYDHTVRLTEITEGMRDLIGGVLDTYLSVVNNRMNDIMKTLTVITTLFMPISFLASFFGMNFFQPVEPLDVWTGRPAFIVMCVLMLSVPVSMFLWVRRRGWM